MDNSINFSTGTEIVILVLFLASLAGIGYLVWTKVFSKNKKDKIKQKVEDAKNNVKDLMK